MQNAEFKNGMTVKQLKELLSSWPDEKDDEPTEVWIGLPGGVSSPVMSAWPLNSRTEDDGSKSADLLLAIAGG